MFTVHTASFLWPSKISFHLFTLRVYPADPRTCLSYRRHACFSCFLHSALCCHLLLCIMYSFVFALVIQDSSKEDLTTTHYLVKLQPVPFIKNGPCTEGMHSSKHIFSNYINVVVASSKVNKTLGCLVSRDFNSMVK